MKKLIFLCFVVLMASCKDKEKEVEPDPDFATEFVGSYWTKTAFDNYETDETWEITAVGKNQISIAYNKDIFVNIPGSPITFWTKYTLSNVMATSKDSFTINETVDVQQKDGKALKLKVEGVVTKGTNSAGVDQLDVTLKTTDVATGATNGNGDVRAFKRK
jgi:hypothetical protein